MSVHVPDAADERRLISLTKQAVALVDGGLKPDDAIEKLAREEQLGRGTIGLLAHAYNTGRQLGQWKSASSLLDKLADFPLADGEKIASAIFPEAVSTPKEANDRTAVSPEYGWEPSWLKDQERESRAHLDLSAMVKAADGEPKPVEKPEYDRGTVMKKAYAEYERSKNAYELYRGKAADCEDQVRRHLASLTDYFKQAACNRMSYARVEHGVQSYMPAVAGEFLKMAYARAKLREKTAADVKIEFQPYDLSVAPFTIIKAGVDAAYWTTQFRAEAARLQRKHEKVAGDTIRPFGSGAAAPKLPLNQPSTLTEKRAMPPAVGGAIGGYLARTLGDVGETKNDLIADAQLSLEDPQHQNEIRKIKAHALLNQLMTDPDDPISSHDPDKVIAAYNEIAQMSPRLAEQPAALRPVLRRRLQGLSEPFEAKEMTDIEKGLAASKTPDTMSLLNKPTNSLMG
jgi:hypothetical protein